MRKKMVTEINSKRRSPHGECGLKYSHILLHLFDNGRSPHGECGLKFLKSLLLLQCLRSLPAWGVWIEIDLLEYCRIERFGRSPHGECGLKCRGNQRGLRRTGRSPHGECGLKFMISSSTARSKQSLPAWGVWIEIFYPLLTHTRPASRSPHGECGLKYGYKGNQSLVETSLPAWGVWIEIVIYLM